LKEHGIKISMDGKGRALDDNMKEIRRFEFEECPLS